MRLDELVQQVWTQMYRDNPKYYNSSVERLIYGLLIHDVRFEAVRPLVLEASVKRVVGNSPLV